MSVSINAMSFDLDTVEARSADQNVRGPRMIFAAITIFFAALTVYGLIGLPRALSRIGESGMFFVGFILIVTFTWITASATLINFGRCAKRITITDQSVEIEYPSRNIPRTLKWDDPQFRLTVRDFRGRANLMANRVQIDQVGKAPFWMQPPASPLTPEAYESLISTAQRKGLSLTRRGGSRLITFWTNTVVTIHRS